MYDCKNSSSFIWNSAKHVLTQILFRTYGSACVISFSVCSLRKRSVVDISTTWRRDDIDPGRCTLCLATWIGVARAGSIGSTRMVWGRKLSICTFISVLIQSVLVIFIEDTFLKCYNVAVQPYYHILVLDRAAKCALACLRDGQCAGVDICRADFNNDDHTCRLRNETSVAGCILQYLNEEFNATVYDDCDSYRRVCIVVRDS
jgi:hypothetical protein